MVVEAAWVGAGPLSLEEEVVEVPALIRGSQCCQYLHFEEGEAEEEGQIQQKTRVESAGAVPALC